MKSYVMPDGRWHHRIRQSWANTFDTCPERARLDTDAPQNRRESDAASVGTAVHAAIEYALEQRYEYDLDVTLEEMEATAFHHLDSIPFLPIKWRTRSGPEGFLRKCVQAWYDHVYPTMTYFDAPPTLEKDFLLTLMEDDLRLVEVSGRMDYFPNDPGDVIRDWKTSGRGEYKTMEYERWAIQPTVYTWAFNELRPDWWPPPVPFQYHVLGAHGHQGFQVTRGPLEWGWMMEKIQSMCLLIESRLQSWPKQDNHCDCVLFVHPA